MCGIFGYAGTKRAAPLVYAGLKKLEYRGYDSAGIATVTAEGITLYKRRGRVEEIRPAREMKGNIGVGHTRWATHGEPSEVNAHPHVFGNFAVVHNGIIENFQSLKGECERRGEAFASETDSEVIAHLLAYYYRGDVLAALKATAARLKGAFALAVLCKEEPEYIYCARRFSPLLFARFKEGYALASDFLALAQGGGEAFALGDGEFARLAKEGVSFYSAELKPIEKEPLEYDVSWRSPEKQGYAHFMKKEMKEIPESVEKSCFSLDKTQFSELFEVLCHTKYLHFVACGTAFHAAYAAKYAAETIARIPTEVCLASEYRYKDPVIQEGTLVVAVSQSGETADTLAAAEIAKTRGAPLLAVTNVPYSSLARLADFCLTTGAGREVAVAATKSYNAQLAALYSLVLAFANRDAEGEIGSFPPLLKSALRRSERVRRWSNYFIGAKCVLFIGRGQDYVSALEGSLKFKEITYLPSEGYAAGELKHGTLALVDGNTPVVAILSDERLAEKTMNAVHEAASRGAKVFLITTIKKYARKKEAFASLLLPPCKAEFSPLVTSVPLQALAYYVALALGNDPDKPRNLAKSVTVE